MKNSLALTVLPNQKIVLPNELSSKTVYVVLEGQITLRTEKSFSQRSRKLATVGKGAAFGFATGRRKMTSKDLCNILPADAREPALLACIGLNAHQSRYPSVNATGFGSAGLANKRAIPSGSSAEKTN